MIKSVFGLIVLLILITLFYIVLNNGKMVIDNETGLMWQDSVVVTQKSWSEAKKYCDNLTLGGYYDWRLPHIDELMSITDKSKYNPAIKEIFINTFFWNDWYWSNTEYANDKTQAWVVSFNNGIGSWSSKRGSNFVRCVR